jgi:hypothetical protein
MSSQRKNKYLFLLDDPDVNRWYNNVSRGSCVTADVYLRRVGSFCQTFNTSPKSLAGMSDIDLYNLMLDYVTTMEKAGYAGSYVESALKSVKSWLSHNGKDVRRKVKIKGARDSPSLKDERVPTQEELRRIFLSSDKKTRVSCVLVAHCGVRIEVLGNYVGQDGLTLADLPELKVENDAVSFSRRPTIVVVRRELSKAGNQYFTFLSEEGCEYVKDYLEWRLSVGEKLTSKSALITPKVTMKPFIRATNIGDNIRNALRAAGLKWRPYVLRSYFDTQLMLAESKGLVLRDYRQFWMGHKGDIENRYTTNKQRLSEGVIEDMREAYRKSQEFLETTKTENHVRDEEKRKRQVLDTAKMLGYSDDKIKKIENALARYKDVDEAFDEIRKLGEEPNKRHTLDSNEKSQMNASNLKGKEIKIVKGENNLIQLLSEKWELIKEISEDRFVLTRLYE